MDLEFGPEYDELRESVRAFCRENWPLAGADAELPMREQEILFRERGIQAGFLYRTVPSEYGGGGVAADILAETVLRRELDAAGVPHRATLQGANMLVPTLLERGTEEQRCRFIPDTLTGRLRWCQGYSEPGAGSDLASLQSRAELIGDEWVINGHKIWTSQATDADYMFGLFRTEPEASKHAGISYLLIDMQSPGIDPRPLMLMNGGVDFCEVFLDDVRIPAGNIVGERGAGWKVSRATLKHERMLIGDASALRRAFDALVELARSRERDGRPAIQDPVIRQRLAEIEGYVASQEYASYRMLSAIANDENMKVMCEMLTTKLSSTNALQMIARLALDLLAEVGLRAPQGDDRVMGIRSYTPGYWVSQYMFSLGQAIAGGTSNIQRNIIGERLLGLPRDPRPPASP